MSTAKPSQSPTNANVGWSASSVALFGNSPNAVYRSVYNDTDKAAYISFGAAGASLTNFTKKLAVGEFFAFPWPTYTNQVTIIGEAAGTGAYRTTQY